MYEIELAPGESCAGLHQQTIHVEVANQGSLSATTMSNFNMEVSSYYPDLLNDCTDQFAETDASDMYDGNDERTKIYI